MNRKLFYPLKSTRGITPWLIISLLLAGLFGLLDMNSAQAQSGRTWYLDNVHFNTGETATGYFTYNADTNTFSDINIQVTRRGSVNNYSSVSPDSPGNATLLSVVAAQGGDLTGVGYLALNFATNMTNAGGAIDILPWPAGFSFQGLCATTTCGGSNGPYDDALAGGRIIAGPRTWYLENVTFDTGATASGSFKYDAETNAYSDINITVSNSSSNGTNSYGVVNPGSIWNNTYMPVISEERSDMTGVKSLALSFAAPLTTNGGTVDILILPGTANESFQGNCNSTCSAVLAPFDEVVTGRVTTVLNQAPTLTSPDSVSVPENETGAIDVEATDDIDSEGNGLTFSLSGGADQALFSIDADSGVVTFNSAPDFENPSDADGDNVYGIEVTVTDSGGLTAVQAITITVTDVAEDSTPPSAAPTLDPLPNAAGWHNSDVTVTWNWADDAGGSGIDASNCTTSSTSSGEGPIELTATCADLAGNVGGESVTVQVDQTAPDTTINGIPSGHTPSADASFVFDGSDALSVVAGFECQLDGGGFSPCASPQAYTDLSNGSHTFEVRAIDAAGNVDPTPASHTWTVASNGAPTITSPDSASVSENQASVIDVQASDDYDTEGAGLTFSLSGGADAALFSIDADSGVVTFDSAPDFENPSDADGDNVYDIEVTVTDSGGLTAVQNIAITVTDVAENVNGAPSAADDGYSTVEDTPLTVDAPGVLDNDSDPDGDTLSALLVDDVSNGTLTLNADGSFSYTPNTDFVGTDSFTYRANDGSEQSTTATVTLTVHPNIIDTNSLLQLTDMVQSYDGTPQPNAPAGTLTLAATFQNKGDSPRLEHLFFEVTTLSHGNLLLNADGGASGVGATLSIPAASLGGNGVLVPGESFGVEFVIGLQSHNAFDFFVDGFGQIDGVTAASIVPLISQNFGEITIDDGESTDSPQMVFLPLVAR